MQGEVLSGQSQALSNLFFFPGVTGQDGSYLSEFLLAKGYEVHGIIRRSSSFNTGRVEHLYKDPHQSKPTFPPILFASNRLTPHIAY